MFCDGRLKLNPSKSSRAWTEPVHPAHCKAHNKTGSSRSGLPSPRMQVYSRWWVWPNAHFIHTDNHIKSENILVSIPQPAFSRIEEYIKANPPSIYGPPLNLKSLPLPLVFSRSQPLPYLSLNGSIEDISIRLVDYGEGEHILPVTHSYRRYTNSHFRR